MLTATLIASLISKPLQILQDLMYDVNGGNFEARMNHKRRDEIGALQQQINPHFLYNTLESIKWMAFRQGADEIVEMTTALGQYFRGSISKKSGLVRMSEELDHLEQYLRIQNIRAKDRFIVIWDVSEALQSSLTVKLILQPIVENAILHGLDTIEAYGLLMIKGYDGSHMHIEILDNGTGMSEVQLQRLRMIKEESRETNYSGIGHLHP
ncbi:histidine kinase [Paenibacillus oryzisoli]|uniref:sensor histidine kinase n=1 Tax=Paenibacillus oryzisoli TaxID=1850517 RepID=UPI003D2830AC